jgi:integrase
MAEWTRGSLPYTAWPAWLQDRWNLACQPGDSFLGHGGAFSDWRPATVENARFALGDYLRGVDAPLSPDAPFITPANIRLYILSMRRRGLRVRTLHTRVAFLFRVAQRLWPDHDWSWLGVIVARLAQRSRRAPKLRRPFVHLRDLYAAGFALMDAAASGRIGVYRVLQYRDGLVLALLAVAPVRLKNAQQATEAHLDLDAHTIAWEGHETKNHDPLCYNLPEDLVERLGAWLQLYRPWLLQHFGKESQSLWLNRRGEALTGRGLREQLKRRSETALGVIIRPHDIRTCVATSIISDFPDRIEDARALLGHRHPRSIESYQTAAASFGAQRTTSTVRADLRKSARPRRKPRLRLAGTPDAL